MTRALLLALALSIPAHAADSASASVTVTASIASYADVTVDDGCALLTTNDPDAVALLNDRPLVADVWTCPTDPEPAPHRIGTVLVRLIDPPQRTRYGPARD